MGDNVTRSLGEKFHDKADIKSILQPKEWNRSAALTYLIILIIVVLEMCIGFRIFYILFKFLLNSETINDANKRGKLTKLLLQTGVYLGYVHIVHESGEQNWV